MPLSERQTVVLAFLEKFHAEQGIFPTRRHTARTLGIGEHAVELSLKGLERHGIIRRAKGRWRAIEIIAASAAVVPPAASAEASSAGSGVTLAEVMEHIRSIHRRLDALAPERRQRLTARERDVLEAIQRLEEEGAISPTLREIGRRLGGLHKATVHARVVALERKGAIERIAGRHRSIVVLTPVERSPSLVPVLGQLRDGAAIEAAPEEEDVDLLLGPARGERFALRVRGSALAEALVADGDYLILERRDEARDGETVLAVLEDGTATLARVRRHGGRTCFVSLDGRREVPTAAEIRGVAIGLFRKLEPARPPEA